MRLGKLQIKVYFDWLEEREGVCSQHDSGEDKHMLLWDFDDSDLKSITSALQAQQSLYNLPTIYILSSSPNKYHAYCFACRTLREIIHILSATPQIDLQYLRLGMIRGYYTLRITPRENDTFKIVRVLPSMKEIEIEQDSITINKYLTANKGGKNA